MLHGPGGDKLFPLAPFLPKQPPEDIRALSWNRQVQHILSSAHPSGKAVVWDLRKNEPIIKVSDHSNRVSAAGQNVGLDWLLCPAVSSLPPGQVYAFSWWACRFSSLVVFL